MPKLIVLTGRRFGRKDETAERLCRVIQASDFDITANVAATDERRVELSFSGDGPNPLQILNAIDAT